MRNVTIYVAMLVTAFVPAEMTFASEQDAAASVAALDEQYQAAVKAKDYDTMNRILADDFVLVIGTGRVFNKADLIGDAKRSSTKYEHQEEIDNSQKVRVWGNTAVVTAKLWIKGTFDGQTADLKVWFSDIYVRTGAGWKYVFGQASRPLDNGH
jgi:ketosteroid isomerase-like protein